MINVSSAMGGQFAWSAAELTAEIRQMGSNPLKGEEANPPERDGPDPAQRIGEEQ